MARSGPTLPQGRSWIRTVRRLSASVTELARQHQMGARRSFDRLVAIDRVTTRLDELLLSPFLGSARDQLKHCVGSIRVFYQRLRT
jgi:hypothetical protein